jgi:hypothetical protein
VHRATYCAHNYPLPLLPSGPGGVGGITSRRTRHSDSLPSFERPYLLQRILLPPHVLDPGSALPHPPDHASHSAEKHRSIRLSHPAHPACLCWTGDSLRHIRATKNTPAMDYRSPNTGRSRPSSQLPQKESPNLRSLSPTRILRRRTCSNPRHRNSIRPHG